MIKYLIYNAINIICFALLAILFNKWWIVLFAALFLMIPKSSFAQQRFRVCDSCGRWSESGKTIEEAIERAEQCGWLHIEDGDKDFCPDCLNKIRRNNRC